MTNETERPGSKDGDISETVNGDRRKVNCQEVFEAES